MSGVHKVKLTVRAGEIVGVAGISGNGQSRLLGIIAGELTQSDGNVKLNDQIVDRLDPAERRNLGLRYVPEQRLGHGAVPSFRYSPTRY